MSLHIVSQRSVTPFVVSAFNNVPDQVMSAMLRGCQMGTDAAPC